MGDYKRVDANLYAVYSPNQHFNSLRIHLHQRQMLQLQLSRWELSRSLLWVSNTMIKCFVSATRSWKKGVSAYMFGLYSCPDNNHAKLAVLGTFCWANGRTSHLYEWQVCCYTTGRWDFAWNQQKGVQGHIKQRSQRFIQSKDILCLPGQTFWTITQVCTKEPGSTYISARKRGRLINISHECHELIFSSSLTLYVWLLWIFWATWLLSYRHIQRTALPKSMISLDTWRNACWTQFLLSDPEYCNLISRFSSKSNDKF